MNPTDLLAALHTAERLKDTTRHCCTSHRRPESAAQIGLPFGGAELCL